MKLINRLQPGRAAAALILAAVFNHFCDRILGVRIEAFTDVLTYFRPLWALDLFLVPFISGILVSAVYGFGGRWLCYFPPAIVRAVSYFEMAHMVAMPAGSQLIPLGWWGFFVILAVEAAALGGIMGEVMIKKTYGRSPPPGSP